MPVTLPATSELNFTPSSTEPGSPESTLAGVAEPKIVLGTAPAASAETSNSPKATIAAPCATEEIRRLVIKIQWDSYLLPWPKSSFQTRQGLGGEPNTDRTGRGDGEDSAAGELHEGHRLPIVAAVGRAAPDIDSRAIPDTR